MSTIQIVCVLGLSAVFIWAATLNWTLFWKGFVRGERTPSLVPFIGGLSGSIAWLVAGHWYSLAWLPLLLDYGALPALVLATRLRRRRR